eukprot:scaffold129396_cov36-Tisochrysis_lutea.AAC.1
MAARATATAMGARRGGGRAPRSRIAPRPSRSSHADALSRARSAASCLASNADAAMGAARSLPDGAGGTLLMISRSNNKCAHGGAVRLAEGPVGVSVSACPHRARARSADHRDLARSRGVGVGWLAGAHARPSRGRRRVWGRMEGHCKGRRWWAVPTRPLGAALPQEATASASAASAPCGARIAEPPH